MGRGNVASALTSTSVWGGVLHPGLRRAGDGDGHPLAGRAAERDGAVGIALGSAVTYLTCLKYSRYPFTRYSLSIFTAIPRSIATFANAMAGRHK
jgi:hypothetical protein